MITWIKNVIPRAVLEKIVNSPLMFRVLKLRYSLFGRPFVEAETSKAHLRRSGEGFFVNYCQGIGLDIGYGGGTCWPLIAGDMT